jgi:hypothetical protein
VSYRSERSVRREYAEMMLALVDDTVRKMNGETAEDPDAEKEYDLQYLLEDLTSRLAMVALYNGADANLFPAAVDNVRARPAYELLAEDPDIFEGVFEVAEADEKPETARGVAKVIPIGHVGPTSEKPIVSPETIREAAMLQTWDGGYPRHEFVAGVANRRGCAASLRPVYEPKAEPVVCHRIRTHEIHNLDPR